jgi:hypothetical protein
MAEVMVQTPAVMVQMQLVMVQVGVVLQVTIQQAAQEARAL